MNHRVALVTLSIANVLACGSADVPSVSGSGERPRATMTEDHARATAPVDARVAPTLIATTNMPAIALTVDDTNVYWTTGWNDPNVPKTPWPMVLTCPKTGCSAPSVIAVGTDSPGSIAVDATSLYWVSGDETTLAQCSLEGCGGMPSLTSVADGEQVVIAAPHALWDGDGYRTDGAASYLVMHGDIFGTPLGGGSTTQIASGVVKDYWGVHVAVDATNVYFHAAERIVACPKDSACTSPKTIADIGNALVLDIASDGTNVYWLGQSAIWRVPVSGGPARLLYANDASVPAPNRIALDATSVYFTTGWASCVSGPGPSFPPPVWHPCSDGTVQKIAK